MKYLVAGRIYTDYKAACAYASLIHKISGLIVAVEAIPDNGVIFGLHPPASPD